MSCPPVSHVTPRAAPHAAADAPRYLSGVAVRDQSLSRNAASVTVGVLLVPSLTSSVFSGRSGESVLPGRMSW